MATGRLFPDGLQKPAGCLIRCRHVSLDPDITMQVVVTAARCCPAPVAAVFACAVDPARFPAMFRGFGPVAGITRIDYADAPAMGARRRVTFTDGSSLQETVTAWDEPVRHAYQLTGFRPPMSWLVREGNADWRFRAQGSDADVTWSYVFTLSGVLAWPFAKPLLAWCMGTAMRRCLDALAIDVARVESC